MYKRYVLHENRLFDMSQAVVIYCTKTSYVNEPYRIYLHFKFGDADNYEICITSTKDQSYATDYCTAIMQVMSSFLTQHITHNEIIEFRSIVDAAKIKMNKNSSNDKS